MIATDRPALHRQRRTMRLVGAGPHLWRVTDERGRIIGHLQRIGGDAELRYRALRYHRAQARLLPVGDFWTPDDAVACLVNSA